MKSLYPVWLLFLCTYLIFSCNKDEKVTPVLTVDKTSINATAAEGIEYLDIASNVEWNISGIPSWMSVNPSSGRGNERVEVSYPTNLKPDALTVTLVLNGVDAPSSRITFTQLGSAPSLLVDKSTLEEVAEGQKDSIIITSNVPWQIVMPANSAWITPSAITGNPGVTKVRFMVAPHTRAGDRIAVIRLESAGAPTEPLVLTMTQEQADIAIISFTAKAKGGAPVTITGSGFSSSLAENTVTINGHNAVVTEASPTELKVTVPIGAGIGKIAVTVGTKTTTSTDDFEYEFIWMVSTVAGDGSTTPFNAPDAVAVGDDGTMYVADMVRHKILKITANGVVSTLAGSGTAGYLEGAPNVARFNNPCAIAVDQFNTVYVADKNNLRIRKIMPNGLVSTVAGDGTVAVFTDPRGITIDLTGNLYVADLGSHKIRKITPDGTVSTLAGSGVSGYQDGDGANAKFTNPRAVTVTENGTVYVAESGERRIRKIDSSGVVSTVVNGLDNNPFLLPVSLIWDHAGHIYVADQARHSIFILTPEGVASIMAGVTGPGYRDGEGLQAQFNLISSLAYRSNGDLYAAEINNRRIRKLARQ